MTTATATTTTAATAVLAAHRAQFVFPDPATGTGNHLREGTAYRGVAELAVAAGATREYDPWEDRPLLPCYRFPDGSAVYRSRHDSGWHAA